MEHRFRARIKEAEAPENQGQLLYLPDCECGWKGLMWWDTPQQAKVSLHRLHGDTLKEEK